MKINVKHELLDLDDQPMVVSRKVDKDGKVTDEKRMTVAHAAVEALLSQFAGDEQLPAETKLLRYTLASRVSKAAKGDGVVELKTEELATIKGLVAKGWPTLVIGRFEEAVERDAVVPDAPAVRVKPDEQLASA